MASTDPDGPDGVRMTWNVWPRTKVDASKSVIPLAVSFPPIRPHADSPTLPYAPLRCRTCSAVLNPFSRVDFSAKIWICRFCFQRNQFPHHYSSLSESNLPAELYPQFTSLLYTLTPPGGAAPPPPPPVYVFVLDTCVIEEELGFAKSAMNRAIGLLPEHALVGFVSFGTQVHVHELGYEEMAKVYIFRGGKEVSKEEVLDQLGLGGAARRTGPGGVAPAYQTGPVQNGVPSGGAGGVNRFLLPASECEFTLNSVGGSVFM